MRRPPAESVFGPELKSKVRLHTPPAARPSFDAWRSATSKAAASRCVLQTLICVCNSPRPLLIATLPCPPAGPRRCAAAVARASASFANTCDAGQAVPFYTRNYQEVDHGLGKGSFGQVQTRPTTAAPRTQLTPPTGVRSPQSTRRVSQRCCASALPLLLTDRAGGCMR
jgi:hypothetical protein